VDLQLQDFNLDPVGHQHLGDAWVHPVVAFEALMELGPPSFRICFSKPCDSDFRATFVRGWTSSSMC
jgi:hypothetical protein